MARHCRLIAQLALVAGFALLAFPAAGSAFSGIGITLTASGPTPSVQTFPAGMYPLWFNQDTVAHTVVFANGLCSFQVAPGGIGQCPVGFFVGGYPYTVDGTTQATVTVTPEDRTLTLRAQRHEIRRGARLTLHGFLGFQVAGPPVVGSGRPSMRVTVLARHDRRHPFRAVATVRPGAGAGAYPWLRHIRPRRTTIYMVEANSQPAAGPYWQPAHSRPFKIVVRPRSRHAR
jgi:hypothetical protein